MLLSYPAILQLAISFSALSLPAISLPPASLPAAIVLLILIIPAIILLAPFGLYLNLGKKEKHFWGSIKLVWLGLTLKKMVISLQSIDELLALIEREKEGKEEQDTDEKRAGSKESAFRRMIWQWREKGRTSGGNKPAEMEGDKLSLASKEMIDSKTDEETAEKTEGKRKARLSPSVRSLIDAAPALAEFLGDLGRSIRIKKFSCHLCFGLDDPAQTAIISGYIWFLASALGISLADMIIDPWFDGLRLEGKLDAEIRARLFSPIWAAIKSLRRKEIRQLVREMLGWR
jgi:hypothetical protein